MGVDPNQNVSGLEHGDGMHVKDAAPPRQAVGRGSSPASAGDPSLTHANEASAGRNEARTAHWPAGIFVFYWRPNIWRHPLVLTSSQAPGMRRAGALFSDGEER